MNSNRRVFLKFISIAGFGLASGGIVQECAFDRDKKRSRKNVTVDNAVATLEDGRVIMITFWRVDSGKEGTSLLLIASQHGNEVQGAEVARRFQGICARQLVTGSVWLLPMANLLAIRSRRHSFDIGPEQNNRMSERLNNVQRHWPGDPEGDETARLAYALDQNVVRHCSHSVDMHCWEHIKTAETLSVVDHEPSHIIRKVTTKRFLRHLSSHQPHDEIGSISQLIRRRRGGAIVIELSGQFQMRERQVQIGLNSMVNIAKELGMINGDPKMIQGLRAVYSPENSHEILAPDSGIFMTATRKDNTTKLMPEAYVEEGQSLGHIICERDLETIPIYAPVSGYLWQYGLCHWNQCDASLPAQHPYAKEGNIIAMFVKV